MALNIGVTPETGFELTSRMVILINEVDTPSALTGVVPVMVVVVAEGEPAVKVTVPPVLVTGEVMERVLICALVDLSEQVASPEAFVAPQATTVFPVPVDA